MNIFRFFIAGIKHITPVILWYLNSALSVAQLADQPSIPTSLQNFAQDYLCAVDRQEHLFVSVNSGIYYPGETIFFKAMLMGNDMKIKTSGSRFFYIQLVDYTGKSIGNYAFELLNGECSGQITIPSNLRTGIYSINAYTRWMLNFGADNYFKRPVMIVSPLENAVMSADLNDSVSLRFYPQCGRLINGVKNKILVRTNQFAQEHPKIIKISNNTGNVIDTCLIDAHGLGVFSLTPESGQTYHATFIGPDRYIKNIPLPLNVSNGYILKPDKDETNLKITVVAGPKQESIDNIRLVMLSESTGNIINQPVTITGMKGQVSVPLTSLSEGLHQILLCSENTILSQCTWYKKEASGSNLKISVNDTLYTRVTTQTKISVSEPSLNQKLFAVIVGKYNPVTDSLLYNECSYLEYFNLYNALPETFNVPVFGTETTEDYINDFLMSVPYTRLTDLLLSTGNRLTHVQEVKGLSLSGQVITLPDRMPLSNAIVLLSFPDSTAHFDFTYTDRQGKFHFVLNDKLYGRQVYIIVQDHSEGFNPVEIIIDDPFLNNTVNKKVIQLTHPVIEPAVGAFQNIALAHRAFYQKKDISSVFFRKNQPYTISFFGEPDFLLIPAEFESLPNIYEIRKNLIPGIKFDIEHDIFKTYIFDSYLQLYYPGPAFVLLNNIPFPSLRNMLELNSDNILKIELKRNKFFYDNYLMFGILAIYTKTPLSIESSYCHKTVTTPAIVESSELQEAKTEKTNLPDIRHTLLWKTNQTYSGEMVVIPFKTPDIKGIYKIRVLNLTNSGKLNCCERSFLIH